MNYSLAKELKDAGFPVRYAADDGVGHVPNLEAHDYAKAYFAGLSLEELIEACVGCEFRIHCYPKGFGGDVTSEPWFVIERPNWSDMPRCSNTEEAVARL